MTYEDQTKEELQEELRDRDLQVSGTKDELIERLEEDDAASGSADGGDARGDDGGTRGGSGRDDRSGGRLTARDALRSAARQVQELGGRQVDGVAGFERVDGGWRVLVEVVEVARVPPSTDVLGAYEVLIDDDGELVGYERVGRFVRSQVGGGDE